MSTIRLQSISRTEATLLSNNFIDHYMPRANGEFVKVYIYLLRILGDSSRSLSLDQMADRLTCTEGDICRALKYWQEKGLLALEYDASLKLSGITVVPAPTAPYTDSPASRPDFIRETAAYGSDMELPSEAPAYGPDTAVSSQTPAVSEEASPQTETPVKASLTPCRMKELKENEDVRQLLYISEQYLGKTLTPTEIQKILFFYDGLGMSVDLIDYLIEYCVGRGHRSMRYIETVAMAWKEDGITTVTAAKDSTSRYGRDYFTILKAMGITNRNPVNTEVSIMDTWMKDYGFSMELIQEACSRTVMQTGQPSFQYADKILSGWLKKGVKSTADIQALDLQHEKRRQEKAARRTPAPKAPNRFNNFHQREYDFADLEKRVLNHRKP